MPNEYTVVGSGPAGIIALVRILEKICSTSNNLVEALKLAKQVYWIDPKFTVGAFGEEWQNVPGNTAANKYQSVYKEIFAILEAYGIKRPQIAFELDTEDPEYPSLLKTAAEPLHYITAQLLQLITPIQGKVEKIKSLPDGVSLNIETKDSSKLITTKRCILATGGKPKVLPLPPKEMDKLIPLEIALDLNQLKQYIKTNPDIFKSCVLVQGSLHSAALAVWNLLECGVQVKQIMNKPYAYYERHKNASGVFEVIHDNDGLKGKVAEFTRKLQAGKVYTGKWSCEIISQGSHPNLTQFSRMVAAIGFKPANTLTINAISSDKLKYNLHTTETEVSGVFAVGVGYPSQATDGTKNVGISKFWHDLGKAVSIWQKNPIEQKIVSQPCQFFRPTSMILKHSPDFKEVKPMSRL